MTLPVRHLALGPDHPVDPSLEWLVTNGLGGYASGPVAGGATRRFHGLLIASLPAPIGRLLCLNHLGVSAIDGARAFLIDALPHAPDEHAERAILEEFILEGGLPVWRYRAGDVVLEKRVVMPYGENTTFLVLKLLQGAERLTIRFRPAFQIRPHEGFVSTPPGRPAGFDVHSPVVEMNTEEGLGPVRWWIDGDDLKVCLDSDGLIAVDYPIEGARGYDHAGHLWAPGFVEATLSAARDVSFVVSTERVEAIQAVTAEAAIARERHRREQLIAAAGNPEDTFVAEMTLAADQFVIAPVGRADEVARARAAGDEPRTVIAGYHWFTDWGRDTMISLEGLTLATGRTREAGCILRTFGHYVRDGLIPNMFPEGERLGLYHTADATLWFFHALNRYVKATGDRATLTSLLPSLVEIAEKHVAGTRFGIGVDHADGLLRQGAAGYQLTWMDAKVGDWVVTPRRGKAVEINALWYNALRLLVRWLTESGREPETHRWSAAADQVALSFNKQFWNESLGYLFDVVDGENGDDPTCRPNQVLALSLDHPVLDSAYWKPVMDVVLSRLVTPVGLRSLAPGHPSYQPAYDGDLRARDAAYHQGTVWAWLIGPFIDAWLRVYPDDRAKARGFLSAFPNETFLFGAGSIGEIFDAERPYSPRGCIAQAWSVGEVLRCYRLTA